ncbi:hypothetical protein RUM43_009502, partial [Polyplax serrata]
DETIHIHVPTVTVLMNLTRLEESGREVLCFYGSFNRKPRTASKTVSLGKNTGDRTADTKQYLMAHERRKCPI